ncbi:thiamin pyrophosphokinase 1-like isoform X2 [Anneissia japonica]|uniref:thiamin pyrophosphokinase 1-like isoform X2 n=1 Tax=Anneissia japonica TaxID=1529436 RepID=UPI0014254E35|nr:thiamin pyrophosphokinase 1-like isoform X2 [Anneissia japonica]
MSSSLIHAAKTLRPLNCLEVAGFGRYALIFLNQPTKVDILKRLWKKAVFRASVDGATNQIFLDAEIQNLVPDLVSGDFDSISTDVLQHCRDIGCKVVTTEDQNETDFTKCLRLVSQQLQECNNKVDYIVALGGLGGRLDHTLASVNTLYKAAKLSSAQVYLIGEESLALLLTPGKYIIEANTGFEADWCGLVPVGQPCLNVTTTGLKWNLTNQKLEFGSLISTSNTYADDQRIVTVETDQPLLWTMGIKMTLL